MVLFLYNSSAYVSSFLFFQVKQNGFGVTNQLEPLLSEQGSHSEFCLVAQNHRREVESNQVKQWCCAFEFRGHNAQTYMLLSQMRTWKPGVLQTSEFLQLCQFYLAVRHRREENLGFFFFFSEFSGTLAHSCFSTFCGWLPFPPLWDQFAHTVCGKYLARRCIVLWDFVCAN